MSKDELAKLLNGREYGSEITAAEALEAKQDGLLVIFGASDDLCELRGAINDEVGAWNGTEIAIQDGRLLPDEVDRDDEEVLEKYGMLVAVKKRIESAIKVSAQWCKTPGYSWTLSTDAPHASFDIMEDGEKYCRGIVLDLKAFAGAGGGNRQEPQK